jgi:hypothetical protein
MPQSGDCWRHAAVRSRRGLGGTGFSGDLHTRDLCRGTGAALVVLTGRAGLVALLCVFPIGFSPWPATA